jgi:hypothetical protein
MMFLGAGTEFVESFGKSSYVSFQFLSGSVAFGVFVIEESVIEKQSDETSLDLLYHVIGIGSILVTAAAVVRRLILSIGREEEGTKTYQDDQKDNQND